MKHIGYNNAPGEWTADTSPGATLALVSPQGFKVRSLYITQPDDVGPVTPMYEHIGWILPADAQVQGGGKIYETREHAGTNGVRIYVKREAPPQPVVVDAMDVRRSEFDEMKLVIGGMSRRIDTLEQQMKRMHVRYQTPEEWQINKPLSETVTVNIPGSHGSLEPRMTFYDHALIAAFISICNSEESNALTRDDILSLAHKSAAHLTAARRPS